MSQILIVDDEPAICWAMRQALLEEGHEVVTVSSAEQARLWYADRTPDAIVMDVRLPGMDGLTAAANLPPHLADTPVIIMTAFGNLETAVQAIGSGAYEYLPKPFDLDQAVTVITRALQSRQLTSARTDQPETVDQPSGMIGRSAAMQEVFRRIALVSGHDVPVLIRGESGTGKELVAQALHRFGTRREGQFVPICVPALSEGVLESELFGHRSGAFTGAVADRPGLLTTAHRGTAFFDEIGDVSLATQVKLLRVLETRQITAVGSSTPQACEFRLIAATHQPLEQMVADGKFREDLLYRLNVFCIDLPPLRQRREDIPLLAEHFLKQFAALGHRSGASEGIPQRFQLTADALTELTSRDWPGNIRELRNAVEHAAVLARDGVITAAHFPEKRRSSESLPHRSRLTESLQDWLQEHAALAPDEGGLFDRFLQATEPQLLAHVLEQTGGNRQEAAARLGIHRQTLREKLRRYGLE